MKCSHCFKTKTIVVDSRSTPDKMTIRRRRECLNCQRRFTTFEKAQLPTIIVKKNDGTQEVLSKQKILNGIVLATQKTNLTQIQAQQIADKIVQNIISKRQLEISSKKIGSDILNELKSVNKVAYLRFKSVYGRFKTIAGFKKEISTLSK